MILKPTKFRLPIKGHWGTKGLVACWLFNDSPPLLGKTLDVSGNRNTGTLVGDTHVVAGKFGPALYFDGAGDYVAIAPCPNVLKCNNSEDLTVLFWMFPTEDGQNIICGNDAGTINGGWCVSQMINKGFYFYVGNDHCDATQFRFSLNVWTQVAIVWSASAKSASYYYNGKFINTDTTANAIGYTAGKPFTIGIDPRDYVGLDYLGQIDHLMIFNRALSASEIWQHYTNSFCMFDREWIELWSQGGAPPGLSIPVAMATYRRRRVA